MTDGIPRETERQDSRLTVVDVARLAGVSPMTVSRALSRPASVSPATREKVQAAIAATGYVPNRIAGSLRSRRSHLVAALVPTLTATIFADAIEALTTRLGKHGYHLFVGQTGYADPCEDELLADIISRRPDAIVLTGASHSATARKLLANANIPVVETWDLASDPIDLLIGFSHEAVGMAVSEYLYSAGCRRLAVIGADDARSRRRWEAFAERTRAFGLRQARVQFVPAPAKLGDGRRALNALMKGAKSKVDGVFCSSDVLANGVLIEAQTLGIAVPDALSVVGFGDLNFAGDLVPTLTSVRVDSTRIGELAAEAIVSRLSGQRTSKRVVDVGFSIVERESG